MKPSCKDTIGPPSWADVMGRPRRPSRPGGCSVVGQPRGVRWLTARRATKKGPREAPADRVERSTCTSRGSLAAWKYGATSGPALKAGGERRESNGAQCCGLLSLAVLDVCQ